MTELISELPMSQRFDLWEGSDDTETVGQAIDRIRKEARDTMEIGR